MPPDPATALLMDSRLRLSPRAELVDTARDAPLWRTELPSGAPLWVATGYDAAELAVTDPRTRRSVSGLSEQWRRHIVNHRPPVHNRITSHLVNADPPEHTRLRRVVAKGLAADRTADLTGRIEEIAERLADDLSATIRRDGAADVIAGYALPLALSVGCEAIGIPRRFRARLLAAPRWTPTRLMDPPGSPVRAGFAARTAGLLTLLEEILAYRSAHPGGDRGGRLLDALLAAGRRGELADHEISSTLFILLLTSYDPLITFVGSALVTLWQRPELLAALRADPVLLAAATGELLRFTSPVAAPMVRHFTEPAEVFGTRVPAGEPVLAHLALANRDPGRFPRPNHLDFNRPGRKDLVFEHGSHYCPGAALATAEAGIALGVLLRRSPELVPAVPERDYRWRPGSTGPLTHLHVVSGLDALPVRHRLGAA